LVVAKDGPKLEQTKPEDLRKSPVTGVACIMQRIQRGAIGMQECTVRQFANDLSLLGRDDRGRRVVDQTGLTGHYTVAQNWASVDTTNPSTAGLGAPAPSRPSIFAAVNEQLGLELKPIKGPPDTIVIDHAEMPSEN
jgi:uncharacterized protein (TIGR03435 family)